MIVPQQVVCDFCANPIERGSHVVKIDVPIPPSLRRELVAYVETEVSPHAKTSVLGELFGADELVPRTWSIESCAPCAFGILPGVRETITRQIRLAIASELAKKRRRLAALQDLEADEAVRP